jgi:xanthine dehydrogenase iron-sulfur cluster and FAD-binding subunit A
MFGELQTGSISFVTFLSTLSGVSPGTHGALLTPTYVLHTLLSAMSGFASSACIQCTPMRQVYLVLQPILQYMHFS